ncbi:MAG: aminotransferase class III-fold pyridoxal phosphate-dependent enzyme [Steroidobacteraceae bacterium]
MNVALQRPLSAADLNFNPARFPLGRLVDFAREHWGVEGEFTPLDGERDQNHRVTAADGTSHVLKVSAAGESEGAVEFQVAALRHLERHAPDLPVPRIIASRAGKDLEWIAAADGTRHMVRLLSWIPGTPLSRGEPLTLGGLRNAAAFQAKLARGLRGMFHPHARHFVAWDIQRVLLLEPGAQAWVAEDAKALCADFSARLQRELLPRLPSLRAQVVHGDGHADNLLRAGPDSDEIVGVIDFGDMVHAPLVQDLAVTLASFARHGEMSLDNAEAQVEAWNAVLPLMDDELEVLHDLTLFRLATALCLYDFRIHATEKPPAWLTDERPDIMRALSKFLALDRAEIHERYRAACGRVGRAPAQVEIAELRERRGRTLGPSYRLFYDRPVHLVRGEGTWLYDADGRRYLDCYNNVASVGHCHPHVVAALARQAATLNTHTRYLHDNVVRYAERLTATLPEALRVCYFVCTGTEANDLAIRIARVVSGQEGVIVSDDSYHGNSNVVGAASTCMYPKSEQPAWLATVPPPNGYRGEFRYGTPDIGSKYAAHIDTAISKLREHQQGAAAWLCDVIFDSNGTFLPPAGYLEYAARAIRAAGGLFIADEVQSGFYRTGDEMWGFRYADVVPDIVTLGKPAGDGHPIGAVITTPAIAAKFAEKFSYFNTFGGNPVSAAVGMAVLDVLERESIQQNVIAAGRVLEPGLARLASKYPLVADVRGKGLFWGLEIVRDHATRAPAVAEADRIMNLLREDGFLLGRTGAFDNVIKIRPPLVFTPDNARMLLDGLDRAMARV